MLRVVGNGYCVKSVTVTVKRDKIEAKRRATIGGNVVSCKMLSVF